jgi:hypothetical protein
MNDYEMMNHRVDQLRLQLADVAKEQLILNRSKEAIMDELLDTRRQITRADKLRLTKLEGEAYPAPVDYLDV